MHQEPKQQQTQRTIQTTLQNIIIPLSFIPPIIILYLLNPDSFRITWTGRAPYIIFLWLFTLELLSTWKKLLDTTPNSKWTTILPTIAIATLPTAYVLITNFTVISNKITEIGTSLRIEQYGEYLLTNSWPLALESIFFAIYAVFSIVVIYKAKALKHFQISIFFLGATAVFFTINVFYPYSSVAALQALVPLTTVTTTGFLNLLGYSAFVSSNLIYIVALNLYQPMPILIISKPPAEPFQVGIFWPSAGVHSLIIYSFTILLFFKGTKLPLNKKVIYTLIGGVGTFFVNVLRIATICIIGLYNGQQSAELFHTYLGEFYFITWIMIFPLIIIYGRDFVKKLSLHLAAGMNSVANTLKHGSHVRKK